MTVVKLIPAAGMSARSIAGGRRVPDDATIVSDFNRLQKVIAVATEWDVSDACACAHLLRLGLIQKGPARPRKASAQAGQPAAEPAASATLNEAFAPAPAEELLQDLVELRVAPELIQSAIIFRPALAPRLSVEDLVLAVTLHQRTGIGPEDAIRLVRAANKEA